MNVHAQVIRPTSSNPGNPPGDLVLKIDISHMSDRSTQKCVLRTSTLLSKAIIAGYRLNFSSQLAGNDWNVS